jgi:hypothetical protein
MSLGLYGSDRKKGVQSSPNESRVSNTSHILGNIQHNTHILNQPMSQTSGTSGSTLSLLKYRF